MLLFLQAVEEHSGRSWSCVGHVSSDDFSSSVLHTIAICLLFFILCLYVCVCIVCVPMYRCIHFRKKNLNLQYVILGNHRLKKATLSNGIQLILKYIFMHFLTVLCYVIFLTLQTCSVGCCIIGCSLNKSVSNLAATKFPALQRLFQCDVYSWMY